VIRFLVLECAQVNMVPLAASLDQSAARIVVVPSSGYKDDAAAWVKARYRFFDEVKSLIADLGAFRLLASAKWIVDQNDVRPASGDLAVDSRRENLPVVARQPLADRVVVVTELHASLKRVAPGLA
jgi:hypothetical protein